jgi:hypothetical protein
MGKSKKPQTLRVSGVAAGGHHGKTQSVLSVESKRRRRDRPMLAGVLQILAVLSAVDQCLVAYKVTDKMKIALR